jgi:hypothetical protein
VPRANRSKAALRLLSHFLPVMPPAGRNYQANGPQRQNVQAPTAYSTISKRAGDCPRIKGKGGALTGISMKNPLSKLFRGRSRASSSSSPAQVDRTQERRLGSSSFWEKNGINRSRIRPGTLAFAMVVALSGSALANVVLMECDAQLPTTQAAPSATPPHHQRSVRRHVARTHRVHSHNVSQFSYRCRIRFACTCWFETDSDTASSDSVTQFPFSPASAFLLGGEGAGGVALAAADGFITSEPTMSAAASDPIGDPVAAVSASGRWPGASTPADFVPTSFDQLATNQSPVTVAGVPEAWTWTLMLLGFSGLGYTAFRRSGRGSASALA